MDRLEPLLRQSKQQAHFSCWCEEQYEVRCYSLSVCRNYIHCHAEMYILLVNTFLKSSPVIQEPFSFFFFWMETDDIGGDGILNQRPVLSGGPILEA